MPRRDPDNLMGRYILGPDHEAIPCPDLTKWAKWLESSERHVAEENVGDYWISTVFLGLDHQFRDGPPLLFETMVFKRKADGEPDMGGEDQFRYSTWDDAVAGHEATVKRYKKLAPAASPSSPRGGAEQGSNDEGQPSR